MGAQKIDDQKLEVCALYSSFHIAQLQVGYSQPHRLGQASVIKVQYNIYSLFLVLFLNFV